MKHSDFIEMCDYYEGLIFKNEEEFLNTFCKSDEFWMLSKISFSSKKVYFSWIEDSGQHFTDDILWTDFLDWAQK